jgi:hypothetical protein
VAFLARGERERGEAVPHVGNKAPASSRTVAPWCTAVYSTLGCWWVGLGRGFESGMGWTSMGCTAPRPGPLNSISYFSKLNWIYKLWKPHFCCSKIYKTLESDRTKDKEQISFWKEVQIPNRIWIKILGSKTGFEFALNLFEVQTCLEKSGKFPKILTCFGLLECEFRLAWLYGKT